MRVSVLVLVACAPLLGQTRWESCPPRFERMPGNAGISLPVRWSLGRMQVLAEASVLPPSITTVPLRRVRVRRAAFAADPASPARVIDCELRLGSSLFNARQLTPDLQYNLPAGLTVVAARRVYSVPATPALATGDAVGADLIDLPLDAPWVLAGGSLFIDWQNYAAALDVSTGHWVDAVHIGSGGDLGMSVPLGARGCGSRAGSQVMTLVAETTAPPTLGVAFPVAVHSALPLMPGFVMAFVEPLRRSPFGLAFGQELSSVGGPGCFLWAGADVSLPALANAQGDLRTSLTLPNVTSLRGSQITVQGVAVDPSLNALGLAFSSGLSLRPDFVGVFDRVSTVMEYRANSTYSPWSPFIGLTPVWLFGY